MGVIVLGVFVVIEPYFGIPNTWHTFFSVIAGLVIIVLGFLLRGETLAGGHKDSPRNSFVENTVVTMVLEEEPEH